MKILLGLTVFVFSGISPLFSQSCTIIDPDGNSATNSSVNWSDARCSQTSAAPTSGSTITIPVGVTLRINNAGGIPVSPDAFHIGDFIVFGTLYNLKSNAQINGSITIKNGGLLNLNSKLFLGDQPGCGYSITIESGGKMDLSGAGAADRLSICGEPVAQSGGGCNPYPAGPLPYCEPAGGFTDSQVLVFGEVGLPIQLLNFNAYNHEGKRIVLRWTTTDEFNFDYFLIERSGDGGTFAEIARVVGAGGQQVRQDYVYDDRSPIQGTNYYRLTSVDLDGSRETFEVVSIDFAGQRAIQVFPNPSDNGTFRIALTFLPNQPVSVVVSDLAGVERQRLSGNGSEFEMETGLPTGTYLVQVEVDGIRQTKRVVVR